MKETPGLWQCKDSFPSSRSQRDSKELKEVHLLPGRVWTVPDDLLRQGLRGHWTHKVTWIRLRREGSCLGHIPM